MITITVWLLVTISSSVATPTLLAKFSTLAECQRVAANLPVSDSTSRDYKSKCIQATIIKE